MSAQHHVVPVRVYLTIITILMVLTVVTVAAAFQDFGGLNMPIAVAIAAVKTVLVVMFFMHLKYSARILWLYAGSGIVFFIIMIAFLLSDYGSRDWIAVPQPWEAPPVVQAVAAPGPDAGQH